MRRLSISRSRVLKGLNRLAFTFCLTLALACTASAANWQVSPIRLDFDNSSRSGVVTIRNDGDEKLVLSVDAKAWAQTAEGKDDYQPTSDLLFFPKKLTVPAKEERVIRVGTKAPAIGKEKTYRVFIKEEQEKKPAEGSVINIAMQFAVPVFIKPAHEEAKGEIRDARLENGQARITIANKGNVHLRIGAIHFTGRNASGEALFSQEVNGWYSLAGSAQPYSVNVPEDTCTALRTIEVLADTDRQLKLPVKIDVDKNACRPKK